MPGFFEDADIERVRAATDIAELISGYVTLKRRGAGDFWGRCPFHGEKTASFHVRTDRGMYHCFGCGKGGNAVSFLMEMERLTFVEAVRMLAERAHIPLPEAKASAPGHSSTEKDRLYLANSFAAKYFHQRLTSTPRSREGQAAFEYLNGRGINLDIIRKFQIGFSEPDWSGLATSASNAGVAGDSLVEAGLAHRRRDGDGYVDRFRARVMFPIINLSGKAVAFGGRRIDGITPDEEQAKYINTNETAVYRKGENLYGLLAAREEIRRTGIAYLVEGYIDLMALVQAGVNNVVASLGTALTEAQAKLVGRFASKVCIVYDGDTAGISAAIRAADTITLAGSEAVAVALPSGDDPDTLLRREGAESLVAALSRPKSFVQFRLESAGDIRSMSQNELLTAARGLLETIRAVPDTLQRDLLMSELANRSGLRREALDKAIPNTVRSPQSNSDTPPNRAVFSADEVVERDLIANLIGHPVLVAEAMEEISADQISNQQLKALFILFEQAYFSGRPVVVESLLDQIADPGIRSFVASAALQGGEYDPEKARTAVQDCTKKILKRELGREQTELEQQLQAAQRDGVATRSLLRRKSELARRIANL